MKRYALVPLLLLSWQFAGCSSTRVFMGNYDLAKITVSHEQAEIVVENLPYEANIVSGKLQREITDDFAFKLSNKPNRNLTEEAKDKSEISVNIVCSDKRTRDQLLENFSSNLIVIKKSLHKLTDSIIMAKVTIHPCSKFNGLDGKYHLVTFETKGELVGGDHRVLVKDPLAFSFSHLESVSSKNQVTMLISRCIDNKFDNITLRDSTSMLPYNMTFQVLSKSISTMKRPIKIFFTTNK